VSSRLVVGIQPVREAIRAHTNAIDKVVIQRRDNPRLSALGRFATDHGVTVDRVERGQLDRLAGGARHQGVIAFAPPLTIGNLSAMQVEDDTLLVVLDGVTDPRNFGATLRSAVALGASGVVWGEHHAAPLTPATFRASAGAVEHASLYRVRSLRGAVSELQSAGVTCVALDASAEQPLATVELTGPVALVIGSEDEGVSRGVRKLCSTRAKLPMSRLIDSLNASVAAAVALYEACRQRTVGQ